MQYPRTIRNFNGFIDGVSYAGRMTEAKLPDIKLQTANHRGAGMDAPMAIDMGMEAMQATGTLIEWAPEVIKLFGTRRRMVLRPAALGEQNFTATAFVITLGGRWSSVGMADLKPANDTPLNITLEVDYFRLVADGDELIQIDVEAGKRIIGGVDQLASIRAAMGL